LKASPERSHKFVEASMPNKRPLIFWLLTLVVIFGILVTVPPTFGADNEKVLYTFCSAVGCSDGNAPLAGIVFDPAGHLYGTTELGGRYDAGTVFELTRGTDGKWIENVLHSFNVSDGNWPLAGLIWDGSGNLYSTTYAGGASTWGTVFELTPRAKGSWTEKVIHTFGNRGELPVAGVILDSIGNLYGTTTVSFAGYGNVYELTHDTNGKWTQKVLHEFGNRTDGRYPDAGVIWDESGSLYGTTATGGTYGDGTVFELSPGASGRWTERVLHSFNNNGKDGYDPEASLTFDGSGNLYGTTVQGGTHGLGTVFELSPGTNGKWIEKVLHSFGATSPDGQGPDAALVFDATGNMYGTTSTGGAYNGGTVFKLMRNTNGAWTEKLLHEFSCNDKGGCQPNGGLTLDGKGNLYGTTFWGGCQRNGGCGTVFEITP
jgi:uncharacterized repeat protein (TIGR03803 family)